MRRRAFRLPFVLLALGGLLGCREETEATSNRGLERFGLVTAPEHQDKVKAAIDDAARLLTHPGDPIPVPGWLADRPARSVPVYSVRADGLGQRELVVTYRECACVIVNLTALTAWLAQAVGSTSSRLDIDPRPLLAYMLLHEMGHIAHDGEIGDRSEAGSAGRSFNLEVTAQKERELAADSFAASAIRSAIAEGGALGLSAQWIALTLSKLSWNLMAHRLLDNFGATILNLPSAFWDPGLSHPNLEWRILVVNDMITHSDDSHQLLSDFEKARAARRRSGGRLWP
jgi:hypothetical protein